jgi:hypothetical protein
VALAHLLGGDLDSGGVFAVVEDRGHRGAGGGRGRADRVHDDFVLVSGRPRQLIENPGEEPVLDLVPLAGARGKMAP